MPDPAVTAAERLQHARDCIEYLAYDGLNDWHGSVVWLLDRAEAAERCEALATAMESEAPDLRAMSREETSFKMRYGYQLTAMNLEAHAKRLRQVLAGTDATEVALPREGPNDGS